MDITHLHFHWRHAARHVGVVRLDWSALPTPVLVSVLSALPLFLVGTLAVQIRSDLGFSNVALGALVSMFSGVAALTSIPASRAVERLGHRAGLVTAAGLTGLALVGMATLGNEWWHLALGQAFAAIGLAVAMPAVQLAMATCIPAERQGFAFGLSLSAIPASILLAGMAVPLIGETVGWRWAYGGAGGLSLVVAAVAGISFGHAGWSLLGRVNYPIQTSLVLTTTAANFLGVWGTQAVATFAVESGVHDGHTAGSIGYAFVGASLVSVSMRILAGWAADRTGAVRAFVVMAGFLLVGAAGISALVVSGSFVAVVIGVVFGVGFGWGWNGLALFSLVRLNPPAAAATAGFVMVGGFAGSALSPVAFGGLVAGPGFGAAWAVSAGAMAAAGVCALVARELASRIEAAATPASP